MQINNLGSNLILFFKRQNKEIQSCLNVTRMLVFLLDNITFPLLNLLLSLLSVLTQLMVWKCERMCICLLENASEKEMKIRSCCWGVCTAFTTRSGGMLSIESRVYIAVTNCASLNTICVFKYHRSLTWHNHNPSSLNWMIEINLTCVCWRECLRFGLPAWHYDYGSNLHCSFFSKTRVKSAL
jgi:hypothetical protein